MYSYEQICTRTVRKWVRERSGICLLKDQNDNSPHFSRKEFVFGVRENNAVGVPVGELELVDEDAEPSATDVLRLVPRMQPAHWLCHALALEWFSFTSYWARELLRMLGFGFCTVTEPDNGGGLVLERGAGGGLRLLANRSFDRELTPVYRMLALVDDPDVAYSTATATIVLKWVVHILWAKFCRSSSFTILLYSYVDIQ